MKTTILVLTLTAISLAGCTANHETLDRRRARISWSAFCAARGYDLSDNTYQATNEYLDTWSGSVEEEAALTAAGAEPY